MVGPNKQDVDLLNRAVGGGESEPFIAGEGL